MKGFKRDGAEKGWWICKNTKPSGEKVEKTQSERPATKSIAVSEKREGSQTANESGFGSTE